MLDNDKLYTCCFNLANGFNTFETLPHILYIFVPTNKTYKVLIIEKYRKTKSYFCFNEPEISEFYNRQNDNTCNNITYGVEIQIVVKTHLLLLITKNGTRYYSHDEINYYAWWGCTK